MSHVALANLRSYTLDNAGAMAAELTEFVLAYFENADPDELQARSTEQLFGMAQAHLRLLDSVPNCHGARIRVFNPDLAEDGFTSEHTVIQIAHDDMPFLVDSVAMAVNRSARTAHWIVHPPAGTDTRRGRAIDQNPTRGHRRPASRTRQVTDFC